MIKPGQVLTDPSSHPPIVRVVCRFPFDDPSAHPRWIVEHINQPTHAVEIVDEDRLVGQVLFTAPLISPLDGSR